MGETAQFGLHDLPVELQTCILSKLLTSPKDLLTCRRVCSNWRNIVQDILYLEMYPVSEKLISLHEIPILNLISSFGIHFRSVRQVDAFLAEVNAEKCWKENPFPSRSIIFNPNDDDVASRRAQYQRFSLLATEVGSHVYSLAYCLSSTVGNEVIDATKSLQNIFIHFPHLHYLVIHAPLCYNNTKWIEAGLEWVESHCFPDLPCLKGIFIAGWIPNMLVVPLMSKYSASVVSMDRSDYVILPPTSLERAALSSGVALRSLSIVIGNEQELKALQTGHWNLSRLSLKLGRHFRPTETLLENLFLFINSLFATLEVLTLNLNFQRLTPGIKPGSLSPHHISCIQPSLTFPKLREYGLLVHCGGSELVLELLDKFVNLKEIWLWAGGHMQNVSISESALKGLWDHGPRCLRTIYVCKLPHKKGCDWDVFSHYESYMNFEESQVVNKYMKL